MLFTDSDYVHKRISVVIKKKYMIYTELYIFKTHSALHGQLLVCNTCTPGVRFPA